MIIKRVFLSFLRFVSPTPTSLILVFSIVIFAFIFHHFSSYLMPSMKGTGDEGILFIVLLLLWVQISFYSSLLLKAFISGDSNPGEIEEAVTIGLWLFCAAGIIFGGVITFGYLLEIILQVIFVGIYWPMSVGETIICVANVVLLLTSGLIAWKTKP